MKNEHEEQNVCRGSLQCSAFQFQLIVQFIFQKVRNLEGVWERQDYSFHSELKKRKKKSILKLSRSWDEASSLRVRSIKWVSFNVLISTLIVSQDSVYLLSWVCYCQSFLELKKEWRPDPNLNPWPKNKPFSKAGHRFCPRLTGLVSEMFLWKSHAPSSERRQWCGWGSHSQSGRADRRKQTGMRVKAALLERKRRVLQRPRVLSKGATGSWPDEKCEHTLKIQSHLQT